MFFSDFDFGVVEDGAEAAAPEAEGDAAADEGADAVDFGAFDVAPAEAEPAEGEAEDDFMPAADFVEDAAGAIGCPRVDQGVTGIRVGRSAAVEPQRRTRPGALDRVPAAATG